MEGENWLDTPKWGSSGEDKLSEELRRTFGALGQEVGEAGAAERSAWGARETPSIRLEGVGGESEEGGSGHSQQLLSSLAPEKDPLQGLVVGSATRSPGRGDPLFTGLSGSPLVVEEGEIGAGRGERGGGRKHGQVKRLFSASMVRRTPLTAEEKAELVVDPLADLSQQSEEQVFVDEPLEEAMGVKVQTSRGSLSPLFDVSQRSRATSQGAEAPVAQPATARSTFQIEVVDPVRVSDMTFSHIEYTVKSRSDVLQPASASVKRRYRDFRWLYRQLQSNHWGCIIPPPPEKQTVGRFNQDFIENRQFQMERMLQKISQHPSLNEDEDFVMFLSSDNFAQDSKAREQATGSRASNDNSDLSEIHISEIALLGPKDSEVVIKNGGLDGDQNSSFMRISFMSGPKYSEPNSYFVEKRQQADVLEEQLRQMYKSLELVDTQKNELVSVIKEFSATLNRLVHLEASKKISDILSNFSDVHLRIMESIQRTSQQDSLTLGITIDEYLRSLGSIKAAFNQRAKLGYYLTIVESDLLKKQTQLEKLSSNIKTPVDKVKLTKQEVSVLQERYNRIKEHWDNIALVLMDELSKFYDAKIADFRNNMEIYLESAIETQKECIELWETFYQNNL